MRRRLYPLLITLSVLVAVETAAAANVEEEFETGALDRNRWCPCQINEQKAPVTFSADPDDARDWVAHITVDENSLGGNECRQEAPHLECGAPPAIALMDETAIIETEAPDFLGPSLMAVTKPEWQPTPDRPDPYCNEQILERVKNGDEERQCIQRQELRLLPQFTHDAAIPHLYSMRFRMPKDVGDKTNSIRWVIAQWKQEPISGEYKKELGDDWGPSPFLAQRFDNGVLHVTVQDEHCRCMIASAPDRDGSTLQWNNGRPEYCQSTRPEDAQGKRCTPDLRVEYGQNPVLSSPAGNWIQMNYRVQADRSGTATIEINDGTRFIARVTGKIGYEPKSGRSSKTKFKIGQYRDYMPFAETIDIDWVKISVQ